MNPRQQIKPVLLYGVLPVAVLCGVMLIAGQWEPAAQWITYWQDTIAIYYTALFLG